MRNLSTTAECSKAIRKELKEKFPDVKFKVHSSNDSAVNIYYIDGPTEEEVNQIVYKYEMGHFNGMEDIYEYNNRQEDIPQVRYIFITREISLEYGQEVLDEFNKYWDRNEQPNIRDSYYFEIPVISSIQDIEWNSQWSRFVNKYNFNYKSNV